MTVERMRGAPARTTGLALLLALLAAGSLLGDRPPGVDQLGTQPWWALALVFALTEACVVRVPVGKESQSISLSEVPLILGLFLCEPDRLLIARLAGSAVVFLLHRRQTLLKTAFNLALVGAATTVAIQGFALLLADAPSLGAQAWVAALSAAAAAGVVEAVALGLVIAWYGAGGPTLAELLRLVGIAAVIPIPVALLGMVAVLAMANGSAAVPLAVTGAAALLGYRAFAHLSDRHASLERMYEFSDSLAEAPGWGDVVESLIQRSGDLMRAGYVEVALAGLGDGPLRWSARGGEPVEGPVDLAADLLSLPFPATALTLVRGVTPAERAFLAGRGLREALLVPLRVDQEVSGHLLVGDRGGEERGYTLRDGRLLETAANHGSVALRNGRLIARLHFEARHDELTGLPNRLSFRDLLDETAALAAAGGPPCTVMVLDFDGFKAINDTLGHQAGDELLRVLSQRLEVAAGRVATVARLGGDEFAILSTVCPGADPAQDLARRLLTAFDEPVALAGNRLRLGGSLGIAIGPAHGRSGSDLLRNADIAMYAAKSGAGGFRLFSPDLVEVTAAALTLASDLRDAVGRDEIGLAVQPLVELSTGRLHSVEVLARWNHPELGEVAPEAFFAAAERSGQITTLSARILDRALVVCRGWHQAGIPVRVAVNLAPRWLADNSLPEQIGLALARHQVPAGLLCLELTESSVIADPRRAILTLARLREMGVHLSVDDFGTGYSSLTYLSRLPVDQMKIDKSFVLRLNESARDRAIARSIVDLGRNLGLEVVAEGVTETASRQVLQEMGCAFGQGYLFSRPVEPVQIPALIARVGQVEPGPGVEWIPRPHSSQFDPGIEFRAIGGRRGR